MKRSQHIRLVLIGLSAASWTSCGPVEEQKMPLSHLNSYSNNHYVPGVGYYHAPFRAWYAQRYNFYDPQRRQYYNGGQWTQEPHASFTNISSPLLAAATLAQAQRSDLIQRGGFGSSSHSRFIGG